MDIAVLILTVSAVFLVADAIVLRYVLQPVFAKHLGDMLYAGGFRLLPAALFYVSYMGGTLYFAALPGLAAGSPGLAFLNGAILGVVAYGTYEFSNWAVMQRWHPQMVIMEVIWGGALTGAAAWAGVIAARAVG